MIVLYRVAFPSVPDPYQLWLCCRFGGRLVVSVCLPGDLRMWDVAQRRALN